jgi:hypothetical protein
MKIKAFLGYYGPLKRFKIYKHLEYDNYVQIKKIKRTVCVKIKVYMFCRLPECNNFLTTFRYILLSKLTNFKTLYKERCSFIEACLGINHKGFFKHIHK